jgi:ABC-type phosphate/phosphonate transport system substrate-binding protein
VRATGSHAKSLELLQRGAADVAAIDCVVVELLRRHRPALLEGVRPIAQTERAPAPPFVTRASMARREVAVLESALNGVFADRSLREVREVLLLDGVEHLGLEAYEPMAAIQRRSACAGYRELDV